MLFGPLSNDATRRRKRRRKGGRRRGSEISRRMKSEKRKNKIGVKAAKGRSNKLVGGGGAPSRGKLCTNVCPVADLWMNCAELYDQWSGWLCKVRGGCLDAISAQLRELHRYFLIFCVLCAGRGRHRGQEKLQGDVHVPREDTKLKLPLGNIVIVFMYYE